MTVNGDGKKVINMFPNVLIIAERPRVVKRDEYNDRVEILWW